MISRTEMARDRNVIAESDISEILHESVTQVVHLNNVQPDISYQATEFVLRSKLLYISV